MLLVVFFPICIPIPPPDTRRTPMIPIPTVYILFCLMSHRQAIQTLDGPYHVFVSSHRAGRSQTLVRGTWTRLKSTILILMPDVFRASTPSAKEINAIKDAVFTIRQLIPSVRIPQGVGGLPLGKSGAVVAEEEHAAEARHVGLAREERRRDGGRPALRAGQGFAEGRQRGGGVPAGGLRADVRAVEGIGRRDVFLYLVHETTTHHGLISLLLSERV